MRVRMMITRVPWSMTCVGLSDYDIIIPDYSTPNNSQNPNENNTFMVIDNNNEREMSFDSFIDDNYSNLL
ncbi:hypothetical protein ENUP19_0011G0010 [Entamoeba nuttalli]|uniref:Uncharacterized protein n=1 Tax=Entamoeba nuttalli TaxID=412467 RepID=A0ABQ0D829_9EUKA